MIFRVVGRLTVGFFRRLGRLLVGTGRAASRHLVGALVVTLLIVGLGVSFVATNGYGLFTSSDDVNIEAPSSDVTSGQAGPAPSTGSRLFLTGLYRQNAQKIWDSLSPRYQASLISKQIDETVLQNRFDRIAAQVKKDGTPLQYSKIQMLGATDLKDKTTLEVYATIYRVGDKVANGDVQLVIDKDQKVDGVQTPTDAQEKIVAIVFNVDTQDTAKTDANGGTSAATTPKAGVGAYDSQVTKAAEDFMYGATNFDAGKIWDNLTPGYQKQLQDQKITQATIQQTFDKYRNDAQQQKQTIAYQGYALLTRISLTNQRTLSKYEGAFTVNGQVLDWEYLLFADSTGKIANIGGQDPLLNKAFGIGSQTSN